MTKRTKKIVEIVQDFNKKRSVEEAIDLLKKCPPVKFDQSIEFSMKLGVDPKRSDQQVRGTVSLPHGTGRSVLLVVFAKGDKIKEALEAGADFAGNEDLFQKINAGWTDFSAVISTPDMMRDVGKLGKVLGPKGLMPTPKAGTVTNDIAKAVKEVKAGKIEFKVDKSSVINNSVGKLSFTKEQLIENIKVLANAIAKAKPSSAKGKYIESLYISSTMGPGIEIDLQTVLVTATT
jgi:large subunit ribosomal protein L1